MSYIEVIEEIIIVDDDDLNIAKVKSEDIGIVSVSLTKAVFTTLLDWKDLSNSIEKAILKISTDEKKLKCCGGMNE